MLRRVALERTDVSEERSSSITRVTKIIKLVAHTVYLRRVRLLLLTAKVPSTQVLVTIVMEALGSSETSVLTTATRRNIPENDILHSHRRGNLKSYTVLLFVVTTTLSNHTFWEQNVDSVC
jgi:hypothetical protein